MRPRAFATAALALSAFACACGSSPSSSSDAAGTTGSGTGAGATTSASTVAGTSTTGSGGAGSTSTSTGNGGAGTSTSSTSSSGTGGKPPLVATPPAGATLCGEGDLKAPDLATGCAASPKMVMVTNPQCDALTSAGGHWQAWCFGGGLSYIWLEVFQAKPTGNCNAVLGGGQNPAELTGGNQAYYGNTTAGSQGGLIQVIPSDVAVDGVLPFSSMKGKGHVWVGGELDCGMMQSKATLFGFDFDWTTN